MTETRGAEGDLYRPLSDVANLLAEGARLRAERLRAADMMTIEEVAAELARDPLEISRGIAEGRCIGIVDAGAGLRLPRWQFEPSIWPEIESICERLGTVDGWRVLAFLERPAKGLEGISPRTALERGIPRECVLAAAAADAH